MAKTLVPGAASTCPSFTCVVVLTHLPSAWRLTIVQLNRRSAPMSSVIERATSIGFGSVTIVVRVIDPIPTEPPRLVP